MTNIQFIKDKTQLSEKSIGNYSLKVVQFPLLRVIVRILHRIWTR